MTEEILTGGGRTSVTRIGDVVHRHTGPWAKTVHALLRHLENEGFTGAPRVIGTGFDATGRETLSFMHGASLHPGPWPDDAMFNLGRLLADFHRASASFTPPEDAIWRPWFGRTLGDGPRIIGHCDLGDWNIIAQNHQPVGFIDWEQAGPVDPLVELAQLCWFNAHLFDDDLQASIGLPPLVARAKKLRYIVDGYGLAAKDRARLVPTMIELAIADAANEAAEANLTPDSTEPVEALWAMAWRARSAAWMGRNRGVLEAVLI
ncbi:aminoglycoside phosphotransferase family protein [Devosia psychrophila]|uniref:Phosphotransferase enzyme family protein n=1 Tax=Devosia psychrophila TaxID=728005 RepID=A0A0F5PR20_9HYPH|nr:aminoglycoside phosphotransferase family protein [Devosia psychrophila]KKC31078.1 trifolitoxin immunity protein [Devosia psychrophila]SFD14581.1 Phosphotransferase enzyme family protein [Devosia psychrophila]